ncbi:MAG: ArgE/DapE family deacylase [Chloroflexi bacterium]|nr:ArgE/DapE family deacylase [Chloroflexota bacterium]
MNVTNSLERKVVSIVDARFDDTIDFLRALVQQPSVLGRERGVQDVVYRRLQSIGLPAEMWDLDLDALKQHPSFGPLDLSYKDRPNVTAVWPAAASGGHSLILNGHIDVVSPEPLANWTHDPYGAQIEGEWMYGRGANDMKSGIAAMLLAVEAARASGAGLRGAVTIESVIEEECTGNGSLACALRGLTADAALVTEPTRMTADHATIGVIWFRVRTRGRASHVLAAESAINAIEKMTPVIAGLRKLEAELNAEANHPLYRNHPHPINLNIGVIQGGDWPSTVPSACTMECRLALLPGVTVAETHAQVRAAVASAAQSDPWLKENPPVVEFFGFRADPSVSDPGAAAWQVLEQCHTDVNNTPLVWRANTATTDQRFFINNLKIPSTSYGTWGENGHAGEERVNIPSIREAARVIALYLMRWCGTAE